MTEPNEIVAAAQRGEPVADALEAKVIAELATARWDEIPAAQDSREDLVAQLRRIRFIAHWTPVGLLDVECDPDVERRALLLEHLQHGVNAQMTVGGPRLFRCRDHGDLWVAPWALDVEVA